MSEHDETLALGQLVKDAAAARIRVEALRVRLERSAATLKKASLQISGVLQDIPYPTLEADMSALPSSATVLELCAEFTSETQRARDLKARVDAVR